MLHPCWGSELGGEGAVSWPHTSRSHALCTASFSLTGRTTSSLFPSCHSPGTAHPGAKGRRSPKCFLFRSCPQKDYGFLVCSPKASSENNGLPEQKQHIKMPRAWLQPSMMDECFLEHAL